MFCHHLRFVPRLALPAVIGSWLIMTGAYSPTSFAQAPDRETIRVELFVVSDSDQCRQAESYLDELQRDRVGLEIRVYDVRKDESALRRLWALARRFGHPKAGVPSFYLADALVVGFRDTQQSGRRVEDLLRIDAYMRPGCRHCQDAKRFLDDLQRRKPALKLAYHDVVNNGQARTEVAQLASQYRVQVASFPCIHVAGRLIVGFQNAETTGRKIESFYQSSTADGSNDDSVDTVNRSAINNSARLRRGGTSTVGVDYQHDMCGIWLAAGFWGPVQQPAAQPPETFQTPPQEDESSTDEADDVLLLEPPPRQAATDGGALAGSQVNVEREVEDAIDVPVWGRLQVSEVGLPVFTFLIGLVDGFNPCAMWVLVFLLSVLVNIKDRKKIIVIAGTFVVVSGLAYFAFMAAWFNVFQLIGLLRPVQVGLGLVAIIVGVINVKDFFAFHQGLSLSIPESAKPGIYRRVRQIVSAKHLTVALLGAITLAIVVNIVELLCTAGLPALYTQILSMQNLPLWANYLYLGLYIVAYMLDDALLVTLVVVTLSHRKLQEAQGRWLKLLSGCVILLLGVVLVFKPEWLV